MKNLKFILVSIIVLGVVALVGYWAFFTIEPGDVYVEKQRQKELEEQNEEMEREIARLRSELGTLQALQEEEVAETEEEVDDTPSPATSTSTEHQALINEIQGLINDAVYMKTGSRGTRVGTIQKFLNVYHNTSKTVDNDYGPGTRSDVIAFQSAEGITADGETGPATYREMIEWLRAQ